MNKNQWLSLILAACMLSSAGAAKVLTPSAKIADQRERVDLEHMIPERFGDWTVDQSAGVAVAPAPDVKASLDKIYDQILSRTYVNRNGAAIMLTITYGSAQTQDLKAHRQEVCYGAQGFEISGLSDTTLSVARHRVPATRMVALKGTRNEPVTYWFTMGDEVVMGRLERLLVQVKYSFSGVIPDGMLVRVSSITPDAKQGFADQAAFLNDLMQTLDSKTATRLLGNNQVADAR